ncbi:MAG: Asp-tRNA(Asn)/Glu-tRNA(Gln) amidotransferase subunit GatB [Candidatus Omnitrophica bacterium]|nr:Asp-tRNA(Asn)/Glu-tRNA(Gln) amidotransferase subunit GatB [Candidatus Omnitrophota bacterium]
MDEFQTVIGLEVHVELLTDSKMFCGCCAKFGAKPNTQVCPVCLGLPGSLPVVNEKAIELAIRTGIALNCKINHEFVFVRKSYFYPDLPKNFQISQYRNPVAEDGYLTVDGKNIGIARIHLEEDTGKLVHDEQTGMWSAVDFNRSGIPLMEIVTKPEISSPQEAENFLQKLKRLISYIGVSDCIMEEGSLRCDANISVKRKMDLKLGTKVELKNMNSFRSVRRALSYEEQRIIEMLKEDKTVEQETRLWNETLQITEGMRTKEEAHDYRYFPEPDLLPFKIEHDLIERIKVQIGELPDEREKRFQKEYLLSSYDTAILTAEKEIADYFEKALSLHNKPKQIANWIQTELLGLLKEHHIKPGDCKVSPESLARIVKMVDQGTISSAAGKTILKEIFLTGQDPEIFVKEKNLTQITDTAEIEKIILQVIQQNQKAVIDYKTGKPQALGFLVGQVIKQSKNKANPVQVKQLLQKMINE